MCPPENIHVYGHVCGHVIGHAAAFGRAHRPSPTVNTILRIIIFIYPGGTRVTPTTNALHQNPFNSPQVLGFQASCPRGGCQGS